MVEKIDDIVVTWTTIDDTQASIVQFGMAQDPYLNWVATGQRTSYVHLRGQWIHRVTLRNLYFNTTYSEFLNNTSSLINDPHYLFHHTTHRQLLGHNVILLSALPFICICVDQYPRRDLSE